MERAVGWEVWSWGESKMGGIREGDIDRLGILIGIEGYGNEGKGIKGNIVWL